VDLLGKNLCFRTQNASMEISLKNFDWVLEKENFLFIKKTFSDLTSMKWWKVNGSYGGSNICNNLEGTDGQQFRPGLKTDDKIVIFQTDLCRTMHMTYQV